MLKRIPFCLMSYTSGCRDQSQLGIVRDGTGKQPFCDRVPHLAVLIGVPLIGGRPIELHFDH